MKPRPRVNPLLALLIGILAASTAAIFIRYAQLYVPSLVIAAYRLGIATLVLAPFVILRKRQELKSLSRPDLLLALLSGLFLALHFAAWITSLEYTSVASSVVLVSTVPLWVALLSPITLKEPITRLVMLGMVLALVGVLIVGLSDICTLGSGGFRCPAYQEFVSGRAFLGDVLALIGAIMAAGYLILGRRLRRRISLTSYVFVVYGMAAFILVILVLISAQPFIGYPPEAYLWLILLALIPQLLGHSTFNWALGFMSAAFVAISLLGEPIGATILAYIVLDETPTTMKIFGAILILTGIYVASRGEVKSINQERKNSNPIS